MNCSRMESPTPAMMNGQAASWIGADPGGAGNFGVALLDGHGTARFCCVDCADEAVDFVRAHLDQPPGGVGVDAPLWWSSGASGDRAADRWLRRTYALGGGAVQAANSLRGAALTQAAMFVQRMREAYPGVGVTESHPKVLLKILARGDWQVFTERFALQGATSAGEHMLDAVISAVSAREGFLGRWPVDLSTDRLAAEQDPASYWLAPVHYYWPER